MRAPPRLVLRAERGAIVALREEWVAAFPGARVPSLPELLAPPASLLRAERSRRLLRVPLAGGRAALVKLYRHGSLEALPTLLAAPLGRREYEGLALFEAEGLPVAPPIGWALERRAGLARASAVLLEWIEAAQDVNAWAEALGPRAQDPSDPGRGAVLDALGRLFREVHARGLALGPKGAHIRNVLLAPPAPPAPAAGGAPPRLLLVDLPNARRASGAALDAERARDLGRLVVRLEGRFGAEGRSRFLAAYHDPHAPAPARAALEAALERERRVAADETAGARFRRAFRRSFRALLGIRSKREAGEGRV
jgi:hypothetical protein